MIKAFFISFRLKNTYKANGFIYFLRQLPLIKKLLPASAYKSRAVKRFADIVAVLGELINTFLWKGIYMAILFAIAISMVPDHAADTFFNAFFFLTIAGGFLNTQLFDPSNDKYYAIVLMRMDAKKYTLSNYVYFLIKVVVGFFPFSCLFAALLGKSALWGILMAFYVFTVKLCFAGYILWDNVNDQKKGRLSDPADKRAAALVIFAAAALCALGFGLPYFKLWIPIGIYPVIVALLAAACVPWGIYIGKSQAYTGLYKELLTKAPACTSNSTNQNQLIQKQTLKKIEYSAEDICSRKKGYGYFNELFFKRHKKLLHKPAKRICLVSLVLFAGLSIICCLNKEMKEGINELLLTMLPFFLFIMYLIHPGRSVTQAMFMNCDHSMLSFRFYRQPGVILSLFVERLKSLVIISLIPAALIGAELAVLLWITGGTQLWINYGLIIITLLMMSVFFSVHYMVLYYLLQPYNVQLESRNAAYGIANAVTYIVCYFFIQRKMPTLVFGTAMTVFCVVYIVVALLLVYRKAPKTFKLR